MTVQFNWDGANNPVGQTIDQMLYRIRSNDKEGLIFDSATLADFIEDSDGVMAVFDALVTPYSRLERKVNQLRLVMDKAIPDLETVSVQVSEPFKQNGSVHVAAVFELSDGQTVSVVFHNPDSTPNKLVASDEMISWKWMLNKKDITIVVAPENGRDLAIREVGRRIMKLAHKNSTGFARLNQKRAEKLENIKNLTGEVEQLEQTLSGLEKEIEAAKAEQARIEEEKNNIPMIKQLFEKLVRGGWKLKNGHDDFLSKEEYAFGAKSNVVVDFNSFDTVKSDIEITAVGGGSKTMHIGTSDLEAEFDEFKIIVEDLMSALHGNGTVDSLLNLLQNTFKMQCERLAPLIFNVTTPRTSSGVTIELDDDGTFQFESDHLSVDHLQGEDNQALIAKKLDELDFVASQGAFDDDPELEGDVIQGGVFKGKSFDFAYTIEQIEIAVNSLSSLSLVFGDFNHTAAAGGTLFDSIASESNPPIEGITAQIGYKPTDIVMARVSVDAAGNAIIYRGETGTTQERGIDAPTSYSQFVPVFKRLIAELTKEPELEEKLPELKAYLDTFTPLKRGQVLKSLSRAAYDLDGARVTVAETVISLAKSEGARVGVNGKDEVSLMNDKHTLSSKLGKIPMNFGIWLIESGTVKPKPAAPESKYPDDFDPTTPENYALVKENGDLEMFQDQLDAFFQNRFIDVRNALRDLGWEGEQGRDLSKNGYTAIPHFKQAGAGANLVGIHYTLNGPDGKDIGFFMSDTLTLSAEQYADRVNMGLPAQPEPIVVNGSDPLDISMANKQNAIQLAENLKTFSQQSWVMRTTLNDVKDLSVDQFRELYQADLEALKSEHDQVIAAFNTLFRAAKVKDRDVIQEIANETNSIYKLLAPKGKQLESEWQKLGGEYTAYQKSLNTDPIVDPDPDTGDDEINTFLNDVIANPGNHTNDESLDRLTELAESLGDDETSEFAITVNKAAKAVQEVAFKQLQDMVSQG